MKILHINTSANKGGAAKACLRLHSALLQHGVDSYVLNLQDENKHNFVGKYIDTFYSKCKHLFNFGLELLCIKLFIKPAVVPFSFGIFGHNITQNKYYINADIIHLHWINQGMLSINDLEEICRSNKKIVWTFHDAWASTGGCHVKAGCTNYLTHCVHCPVVSTQLVNGIPNILFNKKLKLFASNKINVITPSNWLLQEIKKSPITKNTKAINIPNTLNTMVYKPVNNDVSEVPLSSFKIVIGYMKINASAHKGLNYATEAIRLFISNHPTITVETIVFGCTATELEAINLPNCTTLGFINDETEMAQIYNKAHVYIAPYLEDNFPNTVLEALSCGTPVVAFNAGGVPQLVQHMHNGYLASEKNVNDLYNGLYWVHKQEKQTLQANARNYVIDNFSPSHIAKEHCNYYSTIMLT